MEPLAYLLGLGLSITSTATEIIIIEDEPTETSSVTETSSTSIIIIDDPDPSEPESSSLSETLDSWNIRARANIRFDARVAVDTSFDRRNEQVGELHLGARLELDVQLGAQLSVYTAPSFTYVSALDREGDDRYFLYLLPPEAHLTYSAGPVRLRLGTQIFSWGASDLVAPSDVLNPVDLRRNILGLTDAAKIPILAAELVGTFGPFTLRGVVAPFFTAPRFHLVAWDSAVLSSGAVLGGSSLSLDRLVSDSTIDRSGDELLVNQRPSVRIDNATLGARATATFGGLDLALTAVYGWDTLPQIDADPDLVTVAGAYGEILEAGGEVPLFLEGAAGQAQGRLIQKIQGGQPVFEGTYRRRATFGMDLVYALDPLIIKFDLAYTLKRVFYTQDSFRSVRHPWVSAVLGVEYLYGDQLQIIVEVFTLAILDIASNYRISLFEPAAPPPSTTSDGRRTVALPGAICAIRYSILDGDLNFELGFLTTPTRGDFVILPSVQWKLDDLHQLTLGGVAIEGRQDGYGGVYSHTDQLYLAYRFTY